MHYIEFYNLLLVAKIHGYMHADYTATFLSALPCRSSRLVASGWQGGAFPGHGPGGPKNAPPHAITCIARGLRGIQCHKHSVRGGGEVGPDAVGQKQLRACDGAILLFLSI